MIRDLVETVTRGWRLSRTAAVLAVVGALALFPHLLAAQTATTGVVVGKVSDSLGAIVSRAEVVLTDTATTRSRTQRTNEEGQFTFVGVPPGTYQLKVTSEGFNLDEWRHTPGFVMATWSSRATQERTMARRRSPVPSRRVTVRCRLGTAKASGLRSSL